MKIKELIKILEQFNTDGEIVIIYDCQAQKIERDDISIYNGKMPFDNNATDIYVATYEEESKNLIGEVNGNSSSGLIIENKL